ncbi:MAG TPA: cupin domain-containing protein [Candidatus Angelobacter sp.]|nr:cupin domain-containing protein [Candidatus Angelobacter sp.]
MNPEEIIQLLNLKPLPTEGGFFVECYRSKDNLEALPGRYHGKPHCFSTAIYYLLTPETFSAIHRLPSDEIFHFYSGDPVEMLQLFPDGTGDVVRIGPDLKAGFRPQIVVPKDTWQGSRLTAGGSFALMGTTVAPGFEFSDFEAADREALVTQYPEYARFIRELTHS